MPPLDLDLASVWALARRGNRDAAQELCLVVDKVARAELRRRGVGRDDLDDLAQETQQAVLRALKSEREVRNIQAFVEYRTLGVLSDYRKKIRRRRDVPMNDDNSNLPVVIGDPLHSLSDAELRRALKECFLSLPNGLRDVVYHRYHHKTQDTTDIANFLGIKPATVYVRWFRALASLKECLSRKGFSSWTLA